MATEQLHIFAYDVADNRRRDRVSDELLNFGDRVGLSLFECRVEPLLAQEILGRLKDLINAGTDRVNLYRVCGHCERSIIFEGKNWGTSAHR